MKIQLVECDVCDRELDVDVSDGLPAEVMCRVCEENNLSDHRLQVHSLMQWYTPGERMHAILAAEAKAIERQMSLVK